jgi:hypothetical protein
MENARQQPGALPWDPKCLQFPVRGDLANQPDEPAGAAWVWGKDDQVRSEPHMRAYRVFTVVDQPRKARSIKPSHPRASLACIFLCSNRGGDPSKVKPPDHIIKIYKTSITHLSVLVSHSTSRLFFTGMYSNTISRH